jgi:hypothetical protein
MADGHKAHPETDTSGDTTEFAAVEQAELHRVYELCNGVAVSLRESIRTPIEIRVGHTTDSSPLFLHSGRDFPELCQAEGVGPGEPAWVLIQPDVYERDPELGWMVVTLRTDAEIGRATDPQFRFGRDVSREHHFVLYPPAGGHSDFLIVGSKPTKVIVDSREHPFRNYELGG